MKVVGLTGGIGSGKTTVAKMFEDQGAALFIADVEAKKLLNTQPEVISKVKSLLGDAAYITNEEGESIADRGYIASQVFKDKDRLSKLNAIIHPALRTYFQKWKANVNAPYILYEAAILLETGGHQFCDQVVLVSAPEQKRIDRVMKRDGVDETAVRERLSHQWSDRQRLSLSHYVIINEDLQKTRSIVGYIHEVLLN